MQIIQKIPVKHILTNTSRNELKQRFHRRNEQLDQECRQLQFEQKKLERKPELSKQEIQRRFSKEISRRKDRMRWIKQQLSQLDILPNGSELETDEVEALITVDEGDLWEEIQDRQILIEDGKVIRVR